MIPPMGIQAIREEWAMIRVKRIEVQWPRIP
jgi:hypothetical protein